MFKNNFDILKVSERCYQLHCAGKMFRIEFDENDNKQSMFDYLLSSSEGYSKIVMQFKKKYPFNEILDFFFLLKQNGFLYYNTRVRDKKRLEKVGNLVKNSYLYR